jgi:two-component system response regulator AtoC
VFLQYFLKSYADHHRVPMPELAPDTLAELVAYDWPGNVRELKNVAERLIVRNRTGVIVASDLPAEIQQSGRPPRGVSAGPMNSTRTLADELYERMVSQRESFWTAVYAPFMSRDLTRADLRALLRRGLQQSGGSYKVVVELFNMDRSDYKKFLNFLRKHDCQVPFQRFRTARPPQHSAIA